MVEISIGEQELNSLFHSKNNLKNPDLHKKFTKKNVFVKKNGIFETICKGKGRFRMKWEWHSLFLIVDKRQQQIKKFFADKTVHAPKHSDALVNFVCS